jgi:hypothetical protein
MNDSISTGGGTVDAPGMGSGAYQRADVEAREEPTPVSVGLAGSNPAPSTDGGPTAAAFMENVALLATGRKPRSRGKASAGRYASGADADVSLRMVESDLRGIVAELNAAPLSEYDRAKYLGTALGKAEHALRSLAEYRGKRRL